MNITPIELETKRLRLRQWKNEDYVPYAKLNAAPTVMEFFPATLSRIQSDVMASTIKALIGEQGWGYWIVEEKETSKFVGSLGLHKPDGNFPFLPCVEIGWRLSSEHWGKGYAFEAAREVLKFAFEVLELDEVVSFTSVLNKPSWRLMERLGMKNSHENFEHFALPKGDRLCEHVLYRLSRNDFLNNR